MIKEFVKAPEGLLTFKFMASILDMDFSQDLDKAALQVRMVRLRKKIHASGAEGSVIESVRNVGYQLYEPIQII
jgi:DNA-binding response OmpR family regulator